MEIIAILTHYGMNSHRSFFVGKKQFFDYHFGEKTTATKKNYKQGQAICGCGLLIKFEGTTDERQGNHGRRQIRALKGVTKCDHG